MVVESLAPHDLFTRERSAEVVVEVTITRRHPFKASEEMSRRGATLGHTNPQAAANMLVIYNDAVAKSIRAKFRTFVSGRNFYLPDTHGLPPEALAHLMAQWKERTLET
jgi:hypothetical protein